MAYKHYDRLNGLLQFTMKVLFCNARAIDGSYSSSLQNVFAAGAPDFVSVLRHASI
jgi:hypothetical protein